MATDDGSEIDLEIEELPLVFAWDDPQEPDETPSYLTFDPHTQELGLVLGDTQETLSGCILVRVRDNISDVMTYTDTTHPDNGQITLPLSEFFEFWEIDHFWDDLTMSCERRCAQVYERSLCKRGHMFEIKLLNHDWDPLTFKFIFERLDAGECDDYHSKSRKLKAEIRGLKYTVSYLEPERLVPRYKDMREAAEALLEVKTGELERLREEQLLAVAMGFHSRLGAQSAFRGLDPNIFAGLVAPHL